MSPRTTEIATCAARSGCRLTAHLEALALEQGRPHKLRLRSPNRPRTPSSLTMVVHGDQRFASGVGKQQTDRSSILQYRPPPCSGRVSSLSLRGATRYAGRCLGGYGGPRDWRYPWIGSWCACLFDTRCEPIRQTVQLFFLKTTKARDRGRYPPPSQYRRVERPTALTRC